MAYKVITSGIGSGHNFAEGDVVELKKRDVPVEGLNLYERKEDGRLQALEENDVEEIV